MKVSKIQQLLSIQDAHDKQYHADIYYQTTLFKLKHFALHYSKYLSRLILDEVDKDQLMVDTLLITLSFANTLSCPMYDVNLETGLEDNFPEKTIIARYARCVEILTKALDSVDHIERSDPRSALDMIPNLMLETLQVYINTFEKKDFESLVLKRYQTIRDKRLS